MAAQHANSPASSLLCPCPGVTVRPGGSEHPAVRAARKYMEVHFGENISIAKLAGLVSWSPYHFARVFGRQTSFPPHAYLEGVRIRKARELLDGGHTLASAALSAGFADQSHMTHRFKRFLGITPGMYVRQRKIRVGQQQDPNRRVGVAHSTVSERPATPGKDILIDGGLHKGAGLSRWQLQSARLNKTSRKGTGLDVQRSNLNSSR